MQDPIRKKKRIKVTQSALSSTILNILVDFNKIAKKGKERYSMKRQKPFILFLSCYFRDYLYIYV